MSLLRIKPSDNTFFGDGNRFDFGISNVLQSKNTPYPSVFFGAIFTALLTENATFRKDFFEKSAYDHEKILSINQVYLYSEESQCAYIKAPLDLFMDDRNRLEYGTLKQCDSICSSSKYEKILFPPEGKDFERVKGKYINVSDIYDLYQQKISNEIEIIDENNIFKKNYKVGIKIDSESRTAEESMLYKIQQTEFANNDWSYVIDYTINQDYLVKNYKETKTIDLKKGFLKLGGESKTCKYDCVKISDIFKFKKNRKEINFESSRFKIYFTSDTFFEEKIDVILRKNNLKILGMSNDKPLFIGGYDMVKNRSKKMLKGYQAGTILFLETENGSMKKNDLENSIKSGCKGFNQMLILKGDFVK